MSRLLTWFSRSGGMFHKERRGAELEEELRVHVEMLAEENVARGMAPDEARRAAKIALGGVQQIKEAVHEERSWPLLESVAQDVKFALRMLRKNPGFTVVAVLTLALGIGANAAIFTLIDALFLRQLRVERPSELVRVSMADSKGTASPLSFPAFQEIAERQSVFREFFGWYGNGMFNVQVGESLGLADVWAVTANFHSSLGAVPLRGRLFVAADVSDTGTSSPNKIAVLSYGFWQRRFAAAPSVVGQPILVEGQPFTIVGITRKDFSGMDGAAGPDVTVPIDAVGILTAGRLDLKRTKTPWLAATGRLRNGVTIEQARAQITSFWPEVLKATVPDQFPSDRRAEFLSSAALVNSDATGEVSLLRQRYGRPLYLLVGMVVVLLACACLNLANLMLARIVSRSPEISVRFAVGGDRSRLARQFLTETLILCAAGAFAGAAVGYESSGMLVHFFTRYYLVPVELNLAPDWRIGLVTTSVAVCTGIFCSVAPIWWALKRDPAELLQRSNWSIQGTQKTASKILIVLQIAASAILLVTSTLLICSLKTLSQADSFFSQEGLLVFDLWPRAGDFRNFDMDRYWEELGARVAALPGVRVASLSNVRPGFQNGAGVSVAVDDGPTAHQAVQAAYGYASPRYFESIGLHLTLGRDFAWADDGQAPHVAIINSVLADTLFDHENSIGRYFRAGRDATSPVMQIVGVVDDGRLFDFRRPQGPGFYVPMAQYPNAKRGNNSLIVRLEGRPGGTIAAVRRETNALGRDYVFSVRTVGDLSKQLLLPERSVAILALCFGVITLFLSSIGLYALMLHAVTQRTREIGLRMALGAERKEILYDTIRRTCALVLAGLAIGLPAAFAFSRLIESMLYGFPRADATSFVFAAVLLILVGVVSGYEPARRATNIDPMAALRHK